MAHPTCVLSFGPPVNFFFPFFISASNLVQYTLYHPLPQLAQYFVMDPSIPRSPPQAHSSQQTYLTPPPGYDASASFSTYNEAVSFVQMYSPCTTIHSVELTKPKHGVLKVRDIAIATIYQDFRQILTRAFCCLKSTLVSEAGFGTNASYCRRHHSVVGHDRDCSPHTARAGLWRPSHDGVWICLCGNDGLYHCSVPSRHLVWVP